MRTDVAGVIIALVLAFAGMLSVCAQDAKVSEVRKVDAFSSIEITSVGTIHFTQSDTYSFRIEGREKYVKNTQTTVKDGRLLKSTADAAAGDAVRLMLQDGSLLTRVETVETER